MLAIGSFGIATGAVWEIFIILDLIMDSVGASAAGLVAAWGATRE